MKKLNFREISKALSMITQIGISMLVPIFACILIGAYLDNKFDKSPLFLIIFVILGVGAAFRTLYMMTVFKYKKEQEKEIEKFNDDFKHKAK